jgi:ABC-type hemin transport system substrate-binding protein
MIYRSSRFLYSESIPMKRIRMLLTVVFVCLLTGCGRFGSKTSGAAGPQRIVCIGEAYNEMIYALGAQANLVGVDYSSTYPSEIKKLPTVGYHRALSAEGTSPCTRPSSLTMTILAPIMSSGSCRHCISR